MGRRPAISADMDAHCTCKLIIAPIMYPANYIQTFSHLWHRNKFIRAHHFYCELAVSSFKRGFPNPGPHPSHFYSSEIISLFKNPHWPGFIVMPPLMV